MTHEEDTTSAVNDAIIDAWLTDRAESRAATGTPTTATTLEEDVKQHVGVQSKWVGVAELSDNDFDPEADGLPLPFGHSNIETAANDRCDVKVLHIQCYKLHIYRVHIYVY